MNNLVSVLKELEQERARLSSQLENLNNALSALSVKGLSRSGRRISAAGRARIAAAQRARWAKAKGRVVSINANKKRKLSGTALARIRAAQKARWAKWRKEKHG